MIDRTKKPRVVS